MRKTYLDLDQESTIVSMLAVRGLPVDGGPSKAFRRLKVLLTCVALLLLVFALVQESPSWQ